MSEPNNKVWLKAPAARVFMALLCTALAAVAASMLRSHPTSAVSGQQPEPERSSAGSIVRWRGIRLAQATAATDRWSIPHPARLTIHEPLAVRVSAPVLGRVSGVFVEVGDAVKEGDRLFSLSSPEIASLRTERQRAAVELDVARVARDRVVTMVKTHALAGKAELEAETRLRQAELALALAKAKLGAWRVSAAGGDEVVVTAPRAGVIVKKNLLLAQRVGPQHTLLEIADLSQLAAEAEVFEVDVGYVEQGASVRISSPSLPAWSIDATVQMVAPAADGTRHTVAVRALVPNAELALRPNAYVEMRLREAPPPGAVKIPASAIGADGRQVYVYVQSGLERFERRLIEAALGRGDQIVVTAGLSAGDIVIDDGFALFENLRSLD